MRTLRTRPQTSRLRVFAIIAVAIFFALFLSANGVASFYTDWLWFDKLELSSVWTAILTTRLSLSVVFTVIFFAILWGNLYLADRLKPDVRIDSAEEELVERYNAVVGAHAGKVRFGVAALFGLIAGANTASQWETWLLFRNGGEFGRTDPLHARDVGFYVFDLPFWTFLVDWFFAALVLTLIVVVVAHYLNGGIRASVPTDRVTSKVKLHLSILLAVLALFRSLAYWLDRFHLVTSTRGTYDGALATDVNIQLPALNLLTLISLFCAGLFLLNVRRPGWGLPAVAIGIWLVSHFVIGGLFPLIYQRVRVEPVESVREAEFVERNIEATRFAYGLSPERLETVDLDYQVGLTEEDVASYEEVLTNVPVVDKVLATERVTRNEAASRIYSFSPALDIDRYEIDGQTRPVALSVRGLNVGEVGGTWESQHVIFTHGYGVAMAAAYDDEEAPPSGETRALNFLVSGLGDTRINEALGVSLEQPRVYYGEDFGGYSIVGADRNEVDFQDSSNQSQPVRYDGSGGVGIGSFVRRLAFSLRFREIDPLISSNLTGDSRVIYNRDINERVRELAPFLRYDGNPYPVVVDDRIQWVVDGYTTTSAFPYSQSVATGLGATSELGGGFNYVRNSVKAVIDAHNGDVTFYVIDDEDPVITAWRSTFPELFTDGAEMPESVRTHLRYPEDIFTVQTDMWSNYVVSDATQFIQGDVAWSVASQPRTEAQQAEGDAAPAGAMTPQYLMARLPGETDSEFVLQRAFVPVSGAAGTSTDRPELTGIMMARSDGDDYGQLVLVELPRGVVDAPNLVHSEIRQNDDLTDFIRDKAGARVLFGEMGILLVDDTIVYIRPVYVEANSATAVPELQRIVAVNGDRIFMGRTVDEAIAGVRTAAAVPSADSGEETPPEDSSESDDGDAITSVPDPDGRSVVELIADAEQLLSDAEAAESNDLDVQAANLRERARQTLFLAQQLLGGSATAPATTQPPANDSESAAPGTNAAESTSADG